MVFSVFDIPAPWLHENIQTLEICFLASSIPFPNSTTISITVRLVFKCVVVIDEGPTKDLDILAMET